MSKKTDLQEKATELDLEFGDKTTIAELEAMISDSEGSSVKKSIVPDDFKNKYKPHGGTCGDELASSLSDATKDEKGKTDVVKLESVMAQNNIDTDKWANLNVGQRRMNLGNVLRGRMKRAETVHVGNETWNAEAEKKVA